MRPVQEKPVIAVCGGVRGLQGSSVVHYILRDGIFTARALTRDIESDKAVELARQGVQVVYADYDKPETLVHAFDGVYGVFGMTNYFEHGDFEREVRQGYNLVDAARNAQVQHFVWSTLEDTPMIPSFATKAKIQRYLLASGVPHTNVLLSFYFETLFSIGMAKQPDGSWDITWPCPPDMPIHFMAPSDVGGWVTAAFIDPEEWIGRDMKICSAAVSLREYAQALCNVGLTVRAHDRTYAEFCAMKADFADPEGWEMMDWLITKGGDRDLALSRRLHGDLKDVHAWAADYMKIPPQMPQFEVRVNFQTFAESGSEVSV